jgi:hypothetical protein
VFAVRFVAQLIWIAEAFSRSASPELAEGIAELTLLLAKLGNRLSRDTEIGCLLCALATRCG